jgi:hypothetical protein
MKMLALVSAVAVLVVGGIAIYANHFLGRVEKKREELDRIFAERAEDLRGLDRRFPPPPAGPLDAKRFVPWLEARTAAALAWEGRIGEAAGETWFHVRETRNAILERLRKELEARSMGLAEYRALSARVLALLALPELEGLRAEWTAKIRARSPDGVPLPPPAADATPAERALVLEHAAAIRDSATADLMLPLLDEIAR